LFELLIVLIEIDGETLIFTAISFELFLSDKYHIQHLALKKITVFVAEINIDI